MNLNNKKISIVYNSFTFLFLLIGILYIYLGEVYMGFARDIVYREYWIKENIFTLINKEFFVFFWTSLFLFTLYKSIKDKNFSFSNIINIFTFLLLIISFYLYIDEYIMFLAVLNIFAIMRLPFLYKIKNSKKYFTF